MTARPLNPNDSRFTTEFTENTENAEVVKDLYV